MKDKKIATKKIRLSRETLRKLSAKSLDEAVGGLGGCSWARCRSACQTWCGGSCGCY
jgi:hypothetical protein